MSETSIVKAVNNLAVIYLIIRVCKLVTHVIVGVRAVLDGLEGDALQLAHGRQRTLLLNPLLPPRPAAVRKVVHGTRRQCGRPASDLQGPKGETALVIQRTDAGETAAG